jgi:outer membrane lipoprotein carrier protein
MFHLASQTSIYGMSLVTSVFIFSLGLISPDAQAQDVSPATSAQTAKAPTYSGSELLKRVQRFYASARDFSADFRQTYTYHIYGRKKVSTGRVFFKKPAKMRWDYEIPTSRFFVADGQTLWVYEPDKAQVFKRTLSSNRLPIALRFMKGEGDFAEDFILTRVEKASHPELTTLHLKPRRPTPDFTLLKLTIKHVTGEVVTSVLVDPTKNSNQIDFVSVKVNQDLQDQRFSFTPPAGVRVIDEASTPRR